MMHFILFKNGRQMNPDAITLPALPHIRTTIRAYGSAFVVEHIEMTDGSEFVKLEVAEL